MFYKQYMFNYIDISDFQIIAILDRDMTGFKNETREDGEFILAHTKGFIDVPRKEYENPYDYLEDGLFKGIIPPELILKSIDEWWEVQRKGKEEIAQSVYEYISKKQDDEFFKEMASHKQCTLEMVLEYLEYLNKERIDYNLEPFDIEKEYKDYLIKYWGNYKVSY